ncbi:ROK family protein [Nostocoides sp.]
MNSPCGPRSRRRPHPRAETEPAGPEVTGELVLQRAEAGDPAAIELVERQGRRLARIVGVLGSLYDPELVIVSGRIAAGIEPVLRVTRPLLVR